MTGRALERVASIPTFTVAGQLCSDFALTPHGPTIPKPCGARRLWVLYSFAGSQPL